MSTSKQVNVEKDFATVREVVQLLTEAIPSRTGPELLAAIDRGDWFHEFHLDYTLCPDDFANDYLFAELMSKYADYPTTHDKREVAKLAFQAREELNATVNRRHMNLYLPEHVPFREMMNAHIGFVGQVLGNVKHKLGKVMTSGYFGPGTTVGTKFDACSLFDKVHANWTCTETFAPLAAAMISVNPLLRSVTNASELHKTRLRPKGDKRYVATHPDLGFVVNGNGTCMLSPSIKIVDGAKLTFVPKSAKTDRVITVEPCLNSFAQNGTGEVMRTLLKKYTSMDLQKQELNLEKAKVAFQEGWATVDLKDASNSLTREWVRRSLAKSPGWYDWLDTIRSRTYRLDNKTYAFELFSGMGNGATFPLESLIFYSMAKAVCESCGFTEEPFVYGDDIIIPTPALKRLKEFFKYAGLEVNQKKTHYATPFRESCGGHFFGGVSVKPFYLKRSLSDERSYYKLHNRIWTWACRDGITFDTRVFPILRKLRSMCPLKKAPLVHPQLGDVGFFPCMNIGANFLHTYKVRVEKGEQFHYSGGKGYYCAMHSALAATTGGLRKGVSVIDFEENIPSKGRFARRSSKTPTFKWQKLVYVAYEFPYTLI